MSPAADALAYARTVWALVFMAGAFVVAFLHH